jgi:hypothetical protein
LVSVARELQRISRSARHQMSGSLGQSNELHFPRGQLQAAEPVNRNRAIVIKPMNEYGSESQELQKMVMWDMTMPLISDKCVIDNTRYCLNTQFSTEYP